MIIVDFIGAVAAAYLSAGLVPGQILDLVNTEFAKRVDAVESCFYRIGGEAGSYGSPHDYSLDPLCRYRITEMTRDGFSTWTITRG